MNVIQSYKKLNNDVSNDFVNCACYTLSYIYARNAGIDIKLHTDLYGKHLFNHIPYKEIIVDLEDINYYDCDLYAFPKIHALENEPLGSIHIDGDVLLKKESLKSLLDFSDYDCIVQSYEDKTSFGFRYDESMKACSNLPFKDYVTKECNQMYNCGILGFNNKELKDEFIVEYKRLAESYKDNKIEEVGRVPDLVIEQKLIYDLTNNKYNVKELLTRDGYNEYAKEIGYCHILGKAKIDRIKEVINKIYELDIDLYNKFKSKFIGIYNCFWV